MIVSGKNGRPGKKTVSRSGEATISSVPNLVQYSIMNTPKPDDVRAQLERLRNFEKFRGPKLRQLLNFIVEEWLANRGENLTEMYIGTELGDTLVFEEDRNKSGFPKTRANLGHVRNRLRIYAETTGFYDPVIVKLNRGSYVPEIAYNPVTTEIPLDPESSRLILRAKTALEARTLLGTMRAMDYFISFCGIEERNSRRTANMSFIPLAASASYPYITKEFREGIEMGISQVRASGVEPWECTFADACCQACYQHAWQKSLTLFEIAISNSQGEATYFWWYTALLASQGRIAKAIALLDAAVRHFARTSIATRMDLALLQIMGGRYVDADETLSASLDFASIENPLIACHFAMLYEAQNRLEDAIGPIMKWFYKAAEAGSKRRDGQRPDLQSLIIGMMVLILARAGGKDGSNAYLNQLLARKAKYERSSSVEIAFGLVGLGRHDEAVDWLTKAAFEECDPFSMWFHLLPPLRHLHGHKGYRALLGKLNLPLQRET